MKDMKVLFLKKKKFLKALITEYFNFATELYLMFHKALNDIDEDLYNKYILSDFSSDNFIHIKNVIEKIFYYNY